MLSVFGVSAPRVGDPGRLFLAFTPAHPLPAWQLTKRALVIGDTEKGAREWGQRASLGAGTGLIAEQERGPSRSIGHFQQVRAVAPLTRRAESSLSDNLAPQVGFEPTTLRLTAEWLIGASRCKH